MTDFKYNAWRERDKDVKLDCLFCGEYITTSIEVTGVSGVRDRKEAICLSCVEILRQYIKGVLADKALFQRLESATEGVGRTNESR